MARDREWDSTVAPLRAKKHLGQHFLHDGRVVARILGLLEGRAGTRVLEVGPGPGCLTFPLLAARHAVLAVEADEDMVALLSERAQPGLELVYGDFLSWPGFAELTEPLAVLGNLPYNVSVPITARLLSRAALFPRMVLMYQKEVALRLRAPSGCKDYGPISILSAQSHQCTAHFDVGPGAFRPAPKVCSQVIRLDARGEPLSGPQAFPWLDGLTHRLFQQRRKMVRGILQRLLQEGGGALRRSKRGVAGSQASASADGQNPQLGSALLESFDACGFPAQARPEDLSPADYACWYQKASTMP